MFYKISIREFGITRKAAAMLAAGAMFAGCTGETGPETRTIHGIEMHYDVGNRPANEATDLGIDPKTLPYENLELEGNIYDTEGTTTYHVVAHAGREADEFRFQSHGDLDDDVRDIFSAALGESEDLISAAANRGNLDHIIFARGLPSDELIQSHYNPYGNVVAVTLAEKGVSYDELVATLRHELWHAVARDLNFTEEEWEGEYSEACDNLNQLYLSDSLEYLGHIVDEITEYVQAKRTSYPEAHAELAGPLEAVDTYLEAGNGADDIWLYCGQLSVGYALRDLEGAALGLGEQDRAIISSYLRGFVTGSSDIFNDMDPNSEIYRAIGREFIEGDTVYADISEFSYVQSESTGSMFLGHAAEADNFAETWASILNVSTLYTEEFSKKVASMQPAERDFVLTFLRLTIKNITELNPDLSDYLTNKEQLIQQRVGQLSTN